LGKDKHFFSNNNDKIGDSFFSSDNSDPTEPEQQFIATTL